MKLTQLVLPLALTTSLFTSASLERRVTALETLTKGHTELFGHSRAVFEALLKTDQSAEEVFKAMDDTQVMLVGRIEGLDARLIKLEPKKPTKKGK